eukprot:GFKZ01001869.1.p1 GENE.GFKZ01001869.1~~GFKZ01001869.1.p1  ORF type:complete len:949 (+),score=150.38 GFKZ01001869.1:182-3028(+)
MKARHRRPPSLSLVCTVLIRLLFFSQLSLHVLGLNERAAVTAPPSAEQLRAAKESSDAAVKRSHEEHIASGGEPAYIVTLVGKDFGEDDSVVSVRINGIDADGILLHNSTAVSFIIPTSLYLDREAFRSSFVEITIGSLKHRKFPLLILEKAVSKIDLAEYRKKIGRLRPKSSFDSDDDHILEQASHFMDEESVPDYTLSENDRYETNENYDASESSDTDRHISDAGNYQSLDEDDFTTRNPNYSAEDPRDTADVSAKRDELVSEAERLLAERKPRSTEKAVGILLAAISEGDPRAMTVYGASLLSGTAPGITTDAETAVQHLTDASNMGYPDAQAMLGFLYASGIAGTALRKDIGAAILMWTFAAEGGSMYAKMALGYRYFTGTDTPADCDRASMYYASIAQEVVSESKESQKRETGKKKQSNGADSDSIADIRPPSSSEILETDRRFLSEGMTRRVMGEANEIVQYYRHAADRGDPAALVAMGNLYYYGAMDMPQDVDRARQLFTRAANFGRAEAHANLGFMDLRAGRNESAVYHLKQAATDDDKLGLHGMGFVTLHGIGVEKNAELAASYFQKASEKKHPEASFNLAIMHTKGIGVPRSEERALDYYKLAMKGGHLQSTYQIGMAYLEGRSPFERDCTMATQHLKMVAQKGVWNKILSKAFRSYESSAYADALYYYLQAAHAGIELGQYNAAFMFEHNSLSNSDRYGLSSWGLGDSASNQFTEDRGAAVEEALELYQMSASQGHRESLVRMGDLAYGEMKDFARAVSAYERGMKMNSAEAMFNLGWMHARGIGMNPDRFMAKRYFDMAIDADSDAYLPATLANYWLKYSESFETLTDRFTDFWSRSGWLGQRFGADGEDNGSLDLSFSEISDESILIALLCMLIPVIVLRRRRIQARNRMRGGDPPQAHAQGARAPQNQEAARDSPRATQGNAGQRHLQHHEHQD